MGKGNVVNEVGNRYGRLTVVGVYGRRGRKIVWECVCDCGEPTLALTNSLRSGHTRSCGCLKWTNTNFIDRTAQRFGRLLVLCRVAKRSYPYRTQRGEVRWLCLCDCGKNKIVSGNHLKAGNTKSCGCLRSENTAFMKTKYTYPMHKLYKVWVNMISRCENKRNRSYELYHSKGREVCEEWRHAPDNFMEWALTHGWTSKLVIDRIDNSKGYSPDNCRFVTHQVNTHNSDIQRRNKTGYSGVWYNYKTDNYNVYISGIDVPKGKYKRKVHLGTFSTAKEGVEARNEFILRHNLPHQLQGE